MRLFGCTRRCSSGSADGDAVAGTNDRIAVHQDDLDGIADSLNTRPRATHSWQTLLQMFAQTLASSHKPSTTVH